MIRQLKGLIATYMLDRQFKQKKAELWKNATDVHKYHRELKALEEKYRHKPKKMSFL